MASTKVRNLDEDVKRHLRVRAAERGRSMEEETRDILQQAVVQPSEPKNFGQAIQARFAGIGGVDLTIPARTPTRGLPGLK